MLLCLYQVQLKFIKILLYVHTNARMSWKSLCIYIKRMYILSVEFSVRMPVHIIIFHLQWLYSIERLQLMWVCVFYTLASSYSLS